VPCVKEIEKVRRVTPPDFFKEDRTEGYRFGEMLEKRGGVEDGRDVENRKDKEIKWRSRPKEGGQTGGAVFKGRKMRKRGSAGKILEIKGRFTSVSAKKNLEKKKNGDFLEEARREMSQGGAGEGS